MTVSYAGAVFALVQRFGMRTLLDLSGGAKTAILNALSIYARSSASNVVIVFSFAL